MLHGHGGAESTLVTPAGTSAAFSSFWRRAAWDLPHVRRGTLSAALFPAAAVGGAKGFSYVVTLSRHPWYMPRRIQVVDRLGKRVEDIGFHYRAFEVGHSRVCIPSRIGKTVWGWGRLPSEKVTIRLRDITVGRQLPPSIFVIDFHLANIVVDGQAKKVIPVPETSPR